MTSLRFWPFRIGIVALALFASACSGSSEPTTQAPTSTAASASSTSVTPTTSVETTTTAVETTTTAVETTTSEVAADEATEPEPASGGQLSPEQIEECTAPSLPSLPQSDKFRFIAEEFLFECLGVESYKFSAAMEFNSDVGQEFDAIDFNSEAVRVDGEPRFHSSGAVDGRPYEVTRLGDLVWVAQDDGSLRTLDVSGAESFALFEEESTQAQLILGGLGLTYIGFYGGGAVEVGTEEFEGRTLTNWTAGPEEITAQVNNSGLIPIEVDVRSGSIDIWTDENGFVLRALVDLEVDDILLNGVPAIDFPGASDGGLLFDGTYELSYFDLDVANEIEAPE